MRRFLRLGAEGSGELVSRASPGRHGATRERGPRVPRGLSSRRPSLAASLQLSPYAASTPDPFLFPFTTKANSEGTRLPFQGRRALSPLASYRRVRNPPAGLVWVGFLLSNSRVFSADFFLRCSFSPRPLSLEMGGGGGREKKKREMLNESQLARTRGDGEICTKELPHSLAAFSSRNPAGEEGLLSPVHQSSRSRQRRFTMTPSRTATRQGQGSSIASARREPATLRNAPRRGASKPAAQRGTGHDPSGGAALLPPRTGKTLVAPSSSGTARASCQEPAG